MAINSNNGNGNSNNNDSNKKNDHFFRKWRSNGLVLMHWIPNPGVLCSKPLGGSKVDSAFHPSEVDEMSTRNFWELNGKK